MRLLIDIGNSRIKWAVQEPEGLTQQQAVDHHDLTTRQAIDQILKPCGSVDAVLVSNVAGPSIAAMLRQAVNEHSGIEPIFVTPRAECIVRGRVLRNAYQQPTQLGIDRWLAMMAARGISADAVLVVSAGTAMTLDAINAQGQHLGGLIVPGVHLMKHSLLQHTSDLAVRSGQVNVAQSTTGFFADNTLGGIEQGALRAACGLIEAAYQQLQQLADTRLLLTGGAASELQPNMNMKSEMIPNLVLQGLSYCK
jgi:type III pantothenate kinase